ncbi:hypothetical protein pb186bvf_018273 [Paramecium bursaria]
MCQEQIMESQADGNQNELYLVRVYNISRQLQLFAKTQKKQTYLILYQSNKENDQQFRLFEIQRISVIPIDLFGKVNEDKLMDLEQQKKHKYILMQEKTQITEDYTSFRQIQNLKKQSRIDQLLMEQLDDEKTYVFNSVEQGSSQLLSFIPYFLDNLVEDEVKSIEQSPHQSIENDQKYQNYNQNDDILKQLYAIYSTYKFQFFQEIDNIIQEFKMLKLKQRNSYISLLKDTTQTLDLFAQPPIFRILKKNKFTTLVGHLFTLAIAALCFIYFVGILLMSQFFSIRDLINQSSPSVVFNEVQLIDSDPVYLSKNNFTFVITLTRLSLSSLSTFNKDFQITIQNCQRKRNLDPTTGALINVTSNCITYDLERCNMSKHFPTEVQQSYFKNINLTLLLCPNSDQWDQRAFQLQGNTVGTNYQYLTVKASACQNSTNYTGCNSNSTIAAGLASGYYAVYISDTLNQLNNAGNPFTQIINLQFTTFSITSSKEMISYYRPTKVSSDVGLIFKDQQEFNAVMQSSISQTQNIYNNQYLVYHTITLDQKSQVYDRQYQKLQQVLGTIGGFWQVLYFASQLLIAPIIYLMMSLQMANKIFSFVYPSQSKTNVDQSRSPLDENQDMMTPQISQRARETSKMKQSSFFRTKTIYTQNGVNIKDSKKMKHFIKQRTDSLNLGFKEIVLMICGCRQKEKKLINYASDKILQKLDVAYILKKLFELEKIKGLLLDQEQLKLFQYLPKPNIPVNLFDHGNEGKIKELESIQQFQFILQEEKTELIKITEAYLSYMTIKGKRQQTRIDQILINQLDNEVLTLFESIEKGQTKLNQIVSDQVLDHVFDDSNRSRNNLDIDENIGIVIPRVQL